MSDAPFQPSRADGRSDRQVILDLVGNADPDETYSYNDLIAALQEGLDDTKVERSRVYVSVASANKVLLRENKRLLSVVRGVGYRVIRAEEHLPVALNRKASALQQLERGVDILKNARLDEIPDGQRQIHEGQLMILSGLHSAVADSERRHARTESVIDEIKSNQQTEFLEVKERLEALEAQTAD